MWLETDTSQSQVMKTLTLFSPEIDLFGLMLQYRNSDSTKSATQSEIKSGFRNHYTHIVLKNKLVHNKMTQKKFEKMHYLCCQNIIQLSERNGYQLSKIQGLRNMSQQLHIMCKHCLLLFHHSLYKFKIVCMISLKKSSFMRYLMSLTQLIVQELDEPPFFQELEKYLCAQSSKVIYIYVYIYIFRCTLIS